MNMVKSAVLLLVLFAGISALMLLFGAPPEWLGPGAKAHPAKSAFILIMACISSSLLAFGKPIRF